MSTQPVSLSVAHVGVDPRRDRGYVGNSIGMVHHFAGDYAPAGLLPLDGRALDADAHRLLRDVRGTAHLPDLTGRVVVGTDWRNPESVADHGGRSVTLRWIIAIDGLFPTGGVAPARGQIRPFVGSEAPPGWMLCHGQMMQPGRHQALLALLGSAFGGNGQTMFGLPNLAGRAPVGIKPGEVALGQQVVIDGIPGLGINMVITVEGNRYGPEGYGGFDDDEAVLGDILLYASDKPYVTRDGALPADGRLLEIAQYKPLFAVIGTRYGGDGETHFALPDLRGKMLVGG